MLATVAVNLLTCAGLLLALQRRLGGLPLRVWGRDSLWLLLAAVVGGVAAWVLSSSVAWPGGLLGQLLECALSAGLGLTLYGLIASWTGVPEARDLVLQVRARLSRGS